MWGSIPRVSGDNNWKPEGHEQERPQLSTLKEDRIWSQSLGMLKGIGKHLWLLINILGGPHFRSTSSQETPWRTVIYSL